MNRSTTESLFRPDIAPNRCGGLTLYQGTQRMVIEDGEVEAFVRELIEIRRRQLVADCCRIAGVPSNGW